MAFYFVFLLALFAGATHGMKFGIQAVPMTYVKSFVERPTYYPIVQQIPIQKTVLLRQQVQVPRLVPVYMNRNIIRTVVREVPVPIPRPVVVPQIRTVVREVPVQSTKIIERQVERPVSVALESPVVNVEKIAPAVVKDTQLVGPGRFQPAGPFVGPDGLPPLGPGGLPPVVPGALPLGPGALAPIGHSGFENGLLDIGHSDIGVNGNIGLAGKVGFNGGDIGLNGDLGLNNKIGLGNGFDTLLENNNNKFDQLDPAGKF